VIDRPADEDARASLGSAIRDVPDFPRPGIVFKDITPLLADPGLFRRATQLMAAPWRDTGITTVAVIESRGFILGGPIARELGAGVVPVRKAGKLPGACERMEYGLEYGSDALEIQVESCRGSRVLVVDDVLATGGTARAAAQLIERAGGEVAGFSFLMTLDFLAGAKRLHGYRIEAVLSYS
jgi:adenine phosphoribosyltransferase